MANYLVGPDDASFFRHRTTWDLLPAIEAAKDGDVIELQRNSFSSSEEPIILNKNITIEGQIENDEQGQMLLPTISGTIIIKDGVKANLKNIYIQSEKDKMNSLRVCGKSTLIATNLLIENTAQEGKNYPIVYIDEYSLADFDDVLVRESKIHDRKHRVYVENSTFKCIDSTLNAKVAASNSKIDCENVNFECRESNAINIENKSNVTLKNCSIDGGIVEKNCPCLICRDSDLNISDCNIIQKNYSAACYASNSNVYLYNNRIDSAEFLNCKVKSESSTFVESLKLGNKAEFIGDIVLILGRENGLINLFADSNSKIKVDEFCFGRTSNPNIKINRNVDYSVKEAYVLNYDPEKEEFIVNDDGKINVVEDKLKVVYFGKKNAYEQLNEMVGLKQVKSEVTEFVAMAQMNKARKDKGLHTSKMTLHSLFLGNPGTGKTTIARIVGRLLYEKKIIASEKFVETSRSDLVGQYIGETAQKTRKILESALGGVLFIDEAYTLATGGGKDYGMESINEILKFMEDHREDIVIIFAGYTDSMKKFLDMNEGLKSRIPNVFHFEDYSIEELTAIGLATLESEGYKVNKEAYTDLVKHNFELTDDHSNGRWIRNVNEKLIKKLAVRLLKDNKADLSTITVEDIEAVRL